MSDLYLMSLKLQQCLTYYTFGYI